MVVRTIGSQKDSRIVDVARKPKGTLHYDVVYDTTNPEDTIRCFVDNVRGMIARYDGNKARIVEIEAELTDLEHYMEIGKFKKVTDGYRMYRKLAELRRERRACKNENDLLWPIYEHFHATEVLNRLSTVQGEVAKVKSAIDARYYQIRTDALDEWVDQVPDDCGTNPEIDGVSELVMKDELPEDPPKPRKKAAKADSDKKYALVWSEAAG